MCLYSLQRTGKNPRDRYSAAVFEYNQNTYYTLNHSKGHASVHSLHQIGRNNDNKSNALDGKKKVVPITAAQTLQRPTSTDYLDRRSKCDNQPITAPMEAPRKPPNNQSHQYKSNHPIQRHILQQTPSPTMFQDRYSPSLQSPNLVPYSPSPTSTISSVPSSIPISIEEKTIHCGSPAERSFNSRYSTNKNMDASGPSAVIEEQLPYLGNVCEGYSVKQQDQVYAADDKQYFLPPPMFSNSPPPPPSEFLNTSQPVKPLRTNESQSVGANTLSGAKLSVLKSIGSKSGSERRNDKSTQSIKLKSTVSTIELPNAPGPKLEDKSKKESSV